MSYTSVRGMILVIDNQSKFIEDIKQRIEENNMECRICKHSKAPYLRNLNDVEGVILSGGPGDPYGPLNITADLLALMNFDVPTLGLCLGHEIIAVANKGKISRLKRQNKMEKVFINKKDDPIFQGLDNDAFIRKKHYRHVTEVPKNFEIIAHSEACPVEAMKHKTKYIYGFQGHPEVSGDQGNIIMDNFFNICKSLKSESEAIEQLEIKEIPA
ncbi:MAG: gamma-glutamyl-gamma-aminobutyrate hydrolase family protein [Candidatus Nanoarchaeia archaeon]|nr:gamma-glutamyl-gamma-aminobutyrate hydrolase family protein [Candidatus Nanoarchaeia archaeon]